MPFILLNLSDPRHIEVVEDDNGNTLWLEKSDTAKEILKEYEFCIIVEL